MTSQRVGAAIRSYQDGLNDHGPSSGRLGPENRTATSSASLLSVLEFSASLARAETIPSGLEAIADALGCCHAAISRAFRAAGSDHIVATNAPRLVRSPLGNRPWARDLVGAGIDHLEPGAVLSYGTTLEGRGGVEDRLAAAGCGDLVLVVLGVGRLATDVMELQFRDRLDATALGRIAALAPVLSRCWGHRGPGVATVAAALAKPATRAPDGGAIRILSPSNPTGLTRAEFRICALISHGLSISGVVAESALSVSTVRTHLRNVYAKTGCNGFHELAIRLVSLQERIAIRDYDERSA